MGITVHGAGCCLIDYLYADVRFDDPAFTTYLSRTAGDGGLSPGLLVFCQDLEAFSGRPIDRIMDDLVGPAEPDAVNLGGPSIVPLIHLAQMTQDVTIRYFGGRGGDPTGDRITSILDSTPVDRENYVVVEGNTQVTYVLSDPTFAGGRGERMFINDIGAGWSYTPDRLGPEFFGADVVVFGGTAITPPLHGGLTTLLRSARDRGAITVVNTVYDFLSQQKDPVGRWPLGDGEETFGLIDLFIADREEALRTSGQTTLESAAGFFAQAGVSALVITQGPDEIFLFSDGRLFAPLEPTLIPVCDAVDSELEEHPEKRGDTTGCGDNFVGGVLTSLAEQLPRRDRGNLDLMQAGSLGVVSGGFACFYVGGTYIETEQGQKRTAIHPYLAAYREQITL